MSEQNWRTEVTAEDYFLHAKKDAQIESRRPVIRTASDLVGPGIGATAVRITDFNDLLATFNGYYSVAAGALGAPTDDEGFIGSVVSDAELGGAQTFTGLITGTEYRRTFTRSPTDPEALGWSDWSGGRIPATVSAFSINLTTVSPSSPEALVGPAGTVIGPPDVFEISDAGLRIRRQGVYTGHVEVGSYSTGITGVVTLMRPDGATVVGIDYGTVNFNSPVVIPFTVRANNDTTGITVRVTQTVATADFWWRYQCTRTGDAI